QDPLPQDPLRAAWVFHQRSHRLAISGPGSRISRKGAKTQREKTGIGSKIHYPKIHSGLLARWCL
ncbi:MAG: hypothetical protein ACOYKN_08000, partial [Pirellula sp.]